MKKKNEKKINQVSVTVFASKEKTRLISKINKKNKFEKF